MLSRRKLLRSAASGVTAAGFGALATNVPTAQAAPLATLIDYSAAVPSAAAIKAAGHTGVIRYVSDRRPDAQWMLAKPLRATEVQSLRAAGLHIVSCYQYGKGASADWRGGYEAGCKHAERGLELHRAAGGPDDRPIYASIDDNPSLLEFLSLIAPYLKGWEAVLGRDNTGVYANSPTIDLARAAGLGRWYWQHNWGTPKGHVNPAAQLHQFEIDKRKVGGVNVDVNNVLQPDYGQW